MGELWQHGAGELARMIAAGEVSSAEVVDAHLARIEAVNPALNAVTEVLADRARAARGGRRPGGRRRRDARTAARRAVHGQAEHRPRRVLDQLGAAGVRRRRARRPTRRSSSA